MMKRAYGRRLYGTLATCGVALGVWAGCSANKVTELVAGVSTQVQVPRDLKTIRVDVSVGGSVAFCQAYRVYDGTVLLPRTLGTIPEGDPGTPVTILISGYTVEFTDTSDVAAFTDCVNTAPKIGDTQNGPARVLRSSRQPYVPGQILYVPMPLHYSCFDHDCSVAGDATCKGGRCGPLDVLASALVQYSDDLITGNSSTCFSVSTCMTPSVPAIPVDSSKCIYALPGEPDSPALPAGFPSIPATGPGLNVRAIFDGGFVKEILDSDKDEGFTIPDPTKPHVFQLAPGLCDEVHGTPDPATPSVPPAHLITGLEVSGICPSKNPLQPICTSDLNTITSGNASGVSNSPSTPAGCLSSQLAVAPSELLVLVDQTQDMADFYTDQGIQTTLGLSLSDPSFSTTKIGMKLIPTTVANECTTTPNPFQALDVPFELANKAQLDIANAFGNLKNNPASLIPAATPVNLDEALTGGYTAVAVDTATVTALNRRAVLVIENHDFENNYCSASTTAATDAAITAFTGADNIATYVVLIGKSAPADAASDAAAQSLATAGSVGTLTPSAAQQPNVVSAFDARTDETQGFTAFYKVVADLATCVYNTPSTGVLPATAELSFYDPTSLATTTIENNAACTTPNAAADGWGTDSKNRVIICGQPCNTLRASLKNSAATSAALGQAPPGIPVFAAANCK